MQKAAIVYLTRCRDAHMLIHSLLLLYKNFNGKYRYPVVIFHDDLGELDISNVLGYLTGCLGYVPNITFEKLSFELPAWITSDPAAYSVDGPHPTLHQFPMGYRHMCRFFSGMIFEHPALRSYQYYMRLDSDSFILSPIDTDLFETMATQKYQYASYPFGTEDVKEVYWAILGLEGAAAEFRAANPDIAFQSTSWAGEVYNTNLEIVDMNVFREKSCSRLFKHLDLNGGIFYRRWGDAPIRRLTTSMMLRPESIWYMDKANFCYQHGSQVGHKDLAQPQSIRLLPEAFKQHHRS